MEARLIAERFTETQYLEDMCTEAIEAYVVEQLQAAREENAELRSALIKTWRSFDRAQLTVHRLAGGHAGHDSDIETCQTASCAAYRKLRAALNCPAAIKP